jgi:hypothetical protein
MDWTAGIILLSPIAEKRSLTWQPLITVSVRRLVSSSRACLIFFITDSIDTSRLFADYFFDATGSRLEAVP